MEPIYLSIQQKETGSRIKSPVSYTHLRGRNQCAFQNPADVWRRIWTFHRKRTGRRNKGYDPYSGNPIYTGKRRSIGITKIHTEETGRMKKNRMKFLIIEFLLLLLAVFFVWKIFDQNVAEPRIAVILPESGDKRWDALIKGMKQAAAENNVHMIICNTEEIDGPEVEREFIREQKDNLSLIHI